MSMHVRCKPAVRILAATLVAATLGTGCAQAGAGPLRGRGAVMAAPAGPHTAMRPVYSSWRGPTFARPVYLSGYGGYNYTRATSGPLVETTYDGRYDRDCPPHLGHRGR